MDRSGHHPRAFAVGASVGHGNTRAADIRKLRAALGELDYLRSPRQAGLRYTPAVGDAVERFQRDFGLKPDGWIAPDGPTEQALNFALATKREAGTPALVLARTAFAHLNGKGLNFTRDRADFDAPGVWRDRAGNRAGQRYIGTALRDFPRPAGLGQSPAPGRVVERFLGGEAARAMGLGETIPGPAPIPEGKTPKPVADMSFRDLDDPDSVERFYRHHFVDRWRREGKIQASKNLERYLDGTGDALVFSRDEARSFGPVRDLEARNRGHFEAREFRGKTNDGDYNDRIKNLKDGESLTYSRHNDAKSDARNFLKQYVGDETDFALAFGRTSMKSTADFTATRNGDKIAIEGTVRHEWKDTYDFHAGQPGAAGAHLLERAGRARKFPVVAVWKQTFAGTVDIGNEGLSNPKIVWRDIGNEWP